MHLNVSPVPPHFSILRTAREVTVLGNARSSTTLNQVNASHAIRAVNPALAPLNQNVQIAMIRSF